VSFTLVHAENTKHKNKLKIQITTDNTETKHNPEKANNTKHSKTIQHSARKQCGLILQCFQHHMGQVKYVHRVREKTAPLIKML